MPAYLTPDCHKPRSFLALWPRVGRAGSSSSSVPSSSPSLSLSDERAGPEGGATGAWGLSPRQERGERRFTRGRTDRTGLCMRSKVWGDAVRRNSGVTPRYADNDEPGRLCPLTARVQKPSGERSVLAAWPLADAGATQPASASC